jgi:hypothetical protein
MVHLGFDVGLYVDRKPSFPNLLFGDRDKEFKSQRLWHDYKQRLRRVFLETTNSYAKADSQTGRCSREADAKPTTKGSRPVNRSSKYRGYLKAQDAKVNRPEAPLHRDDHTTHFSFHPENMTYVLILRF